jgi:hypothetical protein
VRPFFDRQSVTGLCYDGRKGRMKIPMSDQIAADSGVEKVFPKTTESDTAVIAVILGETVVAKS